MTISEMVGRIRTLASEMVEAFKEMWSKLSEALKSINEADSKDNPYKELTYGWHPVKDTRKKSQVMLNKPRFIVRKIL